FGEVGGEPHFKTFFDEDEREHVSQARFVIHDQQSRFAHTAPAVRTSERSPACLRVDRGSRTVMVVPSPGRDSASIDPPCSSTIFRTIAMPRPVPPSKAVEKGVNSRESSSSLMPRPVSVNRTRYQGPLSRPTTVSRPPADIACTAFFAML